MPSFLEPTIICGIGPLDYVIEEDSNAPIIAQNEFSVLISR
jgi:hypothetical protein